MPEPLADPEQLSEDEALPLSGLQHLAFCPRQWALIHPEQAWAENRLTAEGRLLHERADLPGHTRRHELHTVRGMMLQSQRLRLTGRADVVEFRPEPFPGSISAADASRPIAIWCSSARRRSVSKRC
jgi:CRISPR-associated exonuclease Cas4